MTDISITCSGLSKQYRLGERESYKTLRGVIADSAAAPFRRVFKSSRPQKQNSNGSSAELSTQYPVLNPTRNSKPETRNSFWALDEVSFDVKRGEAVGIVGRNGAGKSTLLKVLSRITKPTKGTAKINGRLGSLLEVGTGFHPELSGRENIFLNGAILGIRKSEIARKFDEIVSFAEIERFVDTPVKRFSSGMYVRLAFAVAAHLETEVLLVDEVLAVGDMLFQRKCLGRMDQASRDGRTVLFVSHDTNAIKSICSRTLLLDEGRIIADGDSEDVLDTYYSRAATGRNTRVWSDPQSAPGGDKIRLHSITILSDRAPETMVDIDRELVIQIEFWNFAEGIRNLFTEVYLERDGNIVLTSPSTPAASTSPDLWFEQPRPAGLFRSTCTVPANFLNEGIYSISVFVATCVPVVIEAECRQALTLQVNDTGVMRDIGGGRWHGLLRPRLAWQTEFIAPFEV